MKNTIILFAVLLCCQWGSAQTKKVDSFSGVSVSGNITAELVRADYEKVEYEILKGDEENLIIKNVNKELVIKTKGSWIKGTQTKARVTVYYKSIDDLEVSSGSSVEVERPIDSDDFDLEVSSGASCTLELNTEQFDVEVSSGSTLRIEGSAHNTDAEVSSGASFNGRDFNTRTADIEVSSGSTARFNVSESLEGDVSSGSSLNYGGNPSKVDVEKDISSGVSRKSN